MRKHTLPLQSAHIESLLIMLRKRCLWHTPRPVLFCMFSVTLSYCLSRTPLHCCCCPSVVFCSCLEIHPRFDLNKSAPFHFSPLFKQLCSISWIWLWLPCIVERVCVFWQPRKRQYGQQDSFRVKVTEGWDCSLNKSFFLIKLASFS